VEFDWVIGPIPVKDGVGKEIISKVTTDIKSEESFFTDANGRQTLKRIRNQRETWDYSVTEPVSGNYYPINSHIFIKNKEGQQLTLLVDRAQGGSSLHDGEIELMTHRRLLVDDGFGVGESLNETAYNQGLVVRGKHYLILSDQSDSAKLYRSLAQELYREPQISFIATDESFKSWSKLYKTKHEFINGLPENINLLTMEQHSDKTILIRLEHMYDSKEDSNLSSPVCIDFDDLFRGYRIQSMRETVLGGNQFTEESSRLSWDTQTTIENIKNYSNQSIKHSGSNYEAVCLGPMSIRTFVLELMHD